MEPGPGGAPSAAPAAAPAQLAPSSFDAAMQQQNNAPQPLAEVKPRTNFDGKIPPPPMAAVVDALPDDGGYVDPNDPAEIRARNELARSGQQPPSDKLAKEEPLQAEILNSEQLQGYLEWKEWNDGLTLPEKFNQKLVSVPWDREKGVTRDVPVAEMKEGYMRVLDYTRKTQAAANIQRRAEQTIQNTNAFLTDLGNGNMRIRLEDLGYGPQLEAAAEEIYAERLAEEKRLYALEKKGASKEDLDFFRSKLLSDRQQKIQGRADARFKLQAQKREQDLMQSNQQREDGKQLENQLAQLRPAAFRTLGLPDNAVHQNAFQQVFMSILQTGGGAGKQLRDVVLMAAQGAQQLVAESISNAQALADEEREKELRNRQPLSPQRLPGPPPRTNGVQQSGNRRLGYGDFDAEMARMDGRA